MNIIKTCRIYAGLSQTDLAKLLGVSRNSVSCWENDVMTPSALMCLKLSYLFQMDPVRFLSATEQLAYDELRIRSLPYSIPFLPAQP